MKTIYHLYLTVLAVLFYSSCTKEEVHSFIGEPAINFTSQEYQLGDMPNSQDDPDDPNQMGYTSNFAAHYKKGQFTDKYDTVYVKAKLEGMLQEHPLRVNLAYESVEGYDTPTLVLPKDSVIKAGEYYVRMAVLVERPAVYNKEYQVKITFDYANSDVVAGSEERQSIILKASDEYEISQENMGVESEEEWNNAFASYIGTYGPVKVRFILSVFKDRTTQIFVYTPYGFGIGFDNPDNVETLKEALNVYNAKHGALTEPDGTVVTFEPAEVK
ncbi:hypothetical protein [Bacteroides faecium]|uniref:DUF4843 domain-containing protein n=1 Tax=Bacteroides faecium TaxID=2715212 RepID=A0A6H0KJJ3_9BACE|nr:hypothetical protein [Bacteroides faecium]QIU93582.1 hypothetical protein BacF7301_05180 [Bacteroides faecium]